MFASVPEAQLVVLTRCIEGRRYAAGERVFAEGEPGDSLVLVVEGSLVASVVTPTGARVELNRMDAGEVVGEMAMLDPAPRSASVNASTEATVYVVGHDAMRVLRAHAPAVLRAVIRGAVRDMTRRLRSLETRIDVEIARAP